MILDDCQDQQNNDSLSLSLNLQLFGFKNAFVQRLLRELVANVGGGDVEQNLLPSSVCNKTSKKGDPIPENDLSTCPDLLSDLKKPGVTRKRSRKEKLFSVNSKNVAGFGKAHAQNQGKFADASNIRQGYQEDHSSTYSATISNSRQNESDNNAEVLQRSEKLGHENKDDNLLVSAENGLNVSSLDAYDHLKVEVTSRRNLSVLEEGGNLPKDKEIVSMFTLIFILVIFVSHFI